MLGYLFHMTQPLAQVWATTDLQGLQPIPHGRPRPDVAAFYTQYPTAAAAGFHGLVDVPAQLPNPVSLRLYAETADGTWVLAQVMRTRVHTSDEEKLPFVRGTAADFDAAALAWRGAIARAGIGLIEDADYTAGVGRLREQFLRHPPRHVATGSPPPATGHAQDLRGRRILLATHNLNREGAPRFLIDLARQYSAQGARLGVVSPEDGPLRAEFEATGATVTVVEAAAVFAARDQAGMDAALGALGRSFDFAAWDLAVCNTFTTFWAVELAAKAGRPVLLYVHESTTPALFYGDRVAPVVVNQVAAAFARADRVSFTTAATRDVHAARCPADRTAITPGWIDVANIDRWLAANSRDALRTRFGLKPGELLVVNIGTVSDRKGQHTFLRAVDLLARRYPELAARTKFVLLGARPGVFTDMLTDVLAGLRRARIELHAETEDYFPYYAAADLKACSSYEESSPRVVLEAMAFRCPLVASAVQGIPELVRPGQEAVLLPAGDTSAWADAMARLLEAPAERAKLAAAARARLDAHFRAEALLPRHGTLAAQLIRS